MTYNRSQPTSVGRKIVGGAGVGAD